MVALGKTVAGVYVIVAPIAAPRAGVAVNGAFRATVCGFTIALTKRISPSDATAWPKARPCGLANPSCPCAVIDAIVPPAKLRGPAPSAAWNKGPYPGPALDFCQLVKYVCN